MTCKKVIIFEKIEKEYAAFMGLIPIMWAVGSGADMMKRIAAPMVGGVGNVFRIGVVGVSGGLLFVEVGQALPRRRKRKLTIPLKFEEVHARHGR